MQGKKDESYLNLILEFVPQTVYKATRQYSKSKQSFPPFLIKVFFLFLVSCTKSVLR